MNVRKRGLALLMCICMIFTLLPFSVFAENAENGNRGGTEGTTQPSVVYGTYDEDGLNWTEDLTITDPTQTYKNVTYSKTAAPVQGADNTYDITLNVSTTVKKSAVVLVLDTSKSSLDCADCGQSYNENLGNIDGNGHKGDCDYYTVTYLTDKDGNKIQDEVWDRKQKKFVPAVDKDGNPVYKKTFTSQPITDEQNFLAAEKASATEFIENYAGSIAGTGKYIQVVSYQGTANIALTEWVDVSTADGMKKAVDAITALQYDSAATNEGKNLEQGLAKAYDCVMSAPNGVKNKYVIAVTNSWFNKAGADGNGDLTWGAYDTANKLKNKKDGNCTVYTVYCRNHESPKKLGVDFDKYLKEKVASPSCAYENTDTGVLYKASWLKNTIGTTILESMKLDTVPTFTVTDPMGEYIELVSTSLTDTSAKYDSVKKTITWTPTVVSSTDGDTISFTLKYTVKLNTGADGFEYGKYYPTNGVTTLKINESDPLSFIVPGVKAERKTIAWDIPLSKTATQFDKDYNTNVTLSVPGVQQSLDSDVVFVLDKSTSAALEDQAIDLLTQLKNQVQDTGAKVKVGVVIFNKQANVTELTDITSEGGLDKITGAIQAKLKDGTNTHAGLLAGKALLDNDTSVSPERKYLIFVSDGITYMYNKNPTAIAWGFTADTPKHFAGPDNYNSKYGNNNPPADWTVWLNNAKTQIDQLAPKYEYEYGKEPTDITDVSDYATTANSIDKALYLTNEVYQEAKAEGYNCYALAAESNVGVYVWGPAFMNMLAGGKTVSFDSIKNDILYAVGTDSYVVDTIGTDFTLDENTLRVKVGEGQYLESIKTNADENGNWVQYFGDAATQLSENSYRFKVEYNAADKTLKWTFNENVSNFAPVQLTYTLKLTTPETKPGTYGQLDLNGDGYIDGTNTTVEPAKALYTNESAVLTPIASNGNKGLPVEFPMPSLAYTVEKPYTPPVDPTVRDKITVEITGNSDSVVYDGTERSVKDYTVKISDSRYTEKDFTFSGKALASGVNAGTYEMGLKADQFKNANARFKNVEFIIKADGVLTITQRPLTITAGSAEGIAPVTCDKYTVEGLATGDKVDSVKITGIQSEPGESPNVASDAVIKNANGEDVTANYKITYVDGVLKAIEVLNKEIHFNYVIGYTDGTIRPNNDISRAEVATIFFRLLTDEAREQYNKTTTSFSDIKDGAWCCRAVATLANMGIINGYTDGTFQPNKSITRGELATIIARFAKLDVNTKTFSDITGHWAQKNIELAAGNGWINGYTDGTFRPNNNITRAETFAMINRVLDRQTESVSDLLPTSEMNMWSDNLNENAWYYKDVQEATNYHKCERVGDSVYETWTEKVPDIDWASYQI